MTLFSISVVLIINLRIQIWHSLMQLSVLCPRGGGGGGGPRDEVETLNVGAPPTWGNLANFEYKCWPRDQEV